MINIYCDSCKMIVGIIEKDALVCSSDQYYGIEIFCNKCKKERINNYYYDINQLVSVMEEKE